MKPVKDCSFCFYMTESGDCLSHEDCFDDYESFKPKYEVYYVTPENKSYKHTEHICSSCLQRRDNCPPYSADFASVYACVNFEAGIKNKEKYPHVIRKLIRTINEIGLDKITYIQTSVLEVTDHEIPQTQHQYLKGIEEVEFEDDTIFITNSWGRYCLKMDRIIGFGVRKENK